MYEGIGLMLDETYELFSKVHTWTGCDLRVALATVIQTWKSSPRPVGSQMAVNQECEFVGSLSGGCIEREVIEESLTVMTNGQAKRITYGVSHQDALDSGLSCGGTIEIYIELLEPHLPYVSSYLSNRKSFAVLTDLQSGKSEYGDRETQRLGGSADLALEFKKCLKAGKPLIFKFDGREFFIKPHLRPLSLYVVGAVHIAQSLIPMAKIAGFDTTLIDPRSAFASASRFPDTKVMCMWPEEAFPQVNLDERSAVVVLSHDPKFDDPSLQYALKSQVFYIGALGSKKSQKARLERLSASGFSDEQLNRIHGPVGLDIGAKTSSHIAVSILAEMITKLS